MQERVELPDPGAVEVWDRMGSSVPPEWYRPYRETPSDVPPLVPFGEGYRYHITGLYHDVFGFPTQRLDETQAWIQRVFRKLDRNRGQITLFEAEWMDDASTVVVSYGASARAAREGVRMARTKHHRKVGFLKLKTLWPFPEELLERVGMGARRVVVAEMNLGQLSLEVERVVGTRKVRRVLRADGELIHPDEIVEAIRTK
jgi:2-oxoglutarate ferredoxin oxidoreductase subunit alpha